MRSLHIDFESFSTVDIKAGDFRYWEEAEIMLFSYAFDNDPVICMDLFEQDVPDWMFEALVDPAITKKAFNATFERNGIKEYFGICSPVEQWQCTKALAARCGLPLNLAQAASVLRIDQQKDKGGKALINYFCIPVKKPIKKNDFRERNYPQHNREKWEQFKAYNIKDVEAERAVCRALSFYKESAFEKRAWELDQEINERGVAINVPFVRSATKMVHHYEDSLAKEVLDLAGIDNIKSVPQIKKWLFTETGEEVSALNKETIPDILQNTTSDKVRRVIEIRQEASKTSIQKYPRTMSCLCRDGRIHGLHEYYGANRTGRAAGRLLNHQNYPQGSIKYVEPAVDLVIKNDGDWLEYVYGPVPPTLSSLLRSSFIAAPGHELLISDLRGIEARVLAWLAGEDWVLEVCRTHGKVYEMAASRMFNVPFESIGKESPLRKKGKIGVLSGGFGGSVNALIKGGALREGLLEEELPAVVFGYRMSNQNIVAFWKAIEKAALLAIEYSSKVYVKDMYVPSIWIGDKIELDYFAPDRGMSFHMHGRTLVFTLPSGRELFYVNASIGEGKFGPCVMYSGIDQEKKNWTNIDTWGGKLAENATQAVARDILMNGLQNLANAGYKIVLHIHDESVSEMPINQCSLEEVDRLMCTAPIWADGLPLEAESCKSLYWKK